MIDGGGTDGFTGVSTNTMALGDAGALNVVVEGRLTIRNGGEITSEAFVGGSVAGRIVVQAGQLLIDGADAPDFTGISTSTVSAGNAGSVTIDAGRLEIVDGSIDSDTLGSGNAGDVFVTAHGPLTLRAGGSISSDALRVIGDDGQVVVATGAAGTVRVTAQDLLVEDGSISSDTFRSGNAGDVFVTARGALALRAGGFISSDTYADGNGGDVSVSADQLSIVDGRRRSTGVSSEAVTAESSGNAGAVEVDATTIKLRDGAVVSSRAGAAGIPAASR